MNWWPQLTGQDASEWALPDIAWHLAQGPRPQLEALALPGPFLENVHMQESTGGGWGRKQESLSYPSTATKMLLFRPGEGVDFLACQKLSSRGEQAIASGKCAGNVRRDTALAFLTKERRRTGEHAGR